MNWLDSARQLSRAVSQQGLSLFLSQGCAVCDRPQHQTFCPDCQAQLQDLVRDFKGWTPRNEHPLLIGALAPYSGTIKQALRALKYEYRPDVGRALGMALGQQWMARRTLTTRSGPLYALPIPLHRHRQMQRGYNQAELIAQSFCQASGLPLLPQGLIRTEDTLPQYQLGLKARQKNLKDAFQVGQSLQRLEKRLGAAPRVLLVDDIYTTGTTAKSAADVLRRSHIRVVGMVAVARAIADDNKHAK
ncbi:ComF family protein [cf. Phormidesmis sp. LEGE 11477]|uniref:ComF family protein n=1 Tax=cf. Phormidesmis sp. LEGE 11477 TaxID=1828680 RepID=UPI0018820F81|nr:ComF family protein [cf. Phormidesmis sp. LEGE 11477]MBE9063557.1 ComF family protein [cf. Phormidesmis sp. LEGE 11477]